MPRVVIVHTPPPVTPITVMIEMTADEAAAFQQSLATATPGSVVVDRLNVQLAATLADVQTPVEGEEEPVGP